MSQLLCPLLLFSSFLAIVVLWPQAPAIRFCDVPTMLPQNQPLSNYSPALCFAYNGLQHESYTVKAFLLETGNFSCASNQWCGEMSNPAATFTIDNRDGSQTTGRIVVARNMDVFDYPNFRWVADLYNQAGVIVGKATQDATGVARRPPVLDSIDNRTGAPGQNLEFTVSGADPGGGQLSFSAEALPPGASFDSAARRFRWPSPANGTYSVLFKATQTGATPLSDAELVTIQISGQTQTLAFSSGAYSTGEGGPAVLIVTRAGGSTGTVTVQCATSNLTAMAGADYTATSQTLSFADGETSKAFTVPISNDSAVESDETFSVALSNPTNAVLVPPPTATVTIADDDTPARSGQWSSVTTWPVVPIHMHLLPNGKVLFWDRHDRAKGWDGDPRTWAPDTGTFSSVPSPGYDLFCSGHSFLADGRLLVTGGHIPMPPAPVDSGVGEDKASIYDPASNTWTRLPNMNAGRWYPTNVTLGNNDVLTLAGTTVNTTTVNPLPQVWQTAGASWRNLTAAPQGAYPVWADYYPFLYLAPDGRVFSAGPQQAARYLNTAGTGSWANVANSSLSYRDYGSSVLYDDGTVLIVGGNPREPNPMATPTILPSATAEVINLNTAAPTWRQVAPMSVGRRHHTATLLPDGKVLVTGGSSMPGFDMPAGAVLYAEVWNPANESWTILAGYRRYRGYHSTALLLPDGRVLMAGGGHPDPPGGTAQSNAEIFSPPYLFNGPRPEIKAAPERVAYGQTFFVGTDEAASITTVNWIRPGSVTHAFNQNQRINRLSFTRASGGLNVAAPSDANLCPPGHYLLFILNGTGVPSVARIVRITAPGAVASVSAAGYFNAHAPDAITAAFGASLATTTTSAMTLPLLLELGGTRVSVRDSAGVERMAPLFFVSPGQVNYLMPFDTALGTATITITNGDGFTSVGAAEITKVAPGLFTANADGQGVAAGYALRVSGSTQQIEEIAQYDQGQQRFVPKPVDLSPESDQIFLVLFGAGIRGRSELSKVVGAIGGVSATALYAGPQGGFVGLDQVNVGPLPRSLSGRGEVDVGLRVDGKVANTVRVSIK